MKQKKCIYLVFEQVARDSQWARFKTGLWRKNSSGEHFALSSLCLGFERKERSQVTTRVTTRLRWLMIRKFTFKMRRASLSKGLRKDGGLETVCKRTCSGVTKVKPHQSRTSRVQDPLKKKRGHESFKGQQTKNGQRSVKNLKVRPHPLPPPPPLSALIQVFHPRRTFTYSTTS